MSKEPTVKDYQDGLYNPRRIKALSKSSAQTAKKQKAFEKRNPHDPKKETVERYNTRRDRSK